MPMCSDRVCCLGMAALCTATCGSHTGIGPGSVTTAPVVCSAGLTCGGASSNKACVCSTGQLLFNYGQSSSDPASGYFTATCSDA
eukprot:5968-Heterococcus_DN1.PRE.1